MKKSLLAVGLAGVVLTAPALAQTGVSLSAGTTGLGLHASLPLHERLQARIGVNGLTYSYDTSTTDLDYEFDLRLRTADLLLDWHPRDTSFRITGGVIYNDNRIDGTARPNNQGTYTIGGTTYSVADFGTIVGDMSFRKTAPYLGIGWDNARPDSKWSITADLGVMFQGTPRTTLATTGCTAPAPLCDQFARDVEAERVRLQDKADSYKYYPVARIGLMYRF
jgi:hypothetical protein